MSSSPNLNLNPNPTDYQEIQQQINQVQNQLEQITHSLIIISQRIETIDEDFRDFIVDLLEETIAFINIENLSNSLLKISLAFLIFFTISIIFYAVILTRSFNHRLYPYTQSVFLFTSTLCIGLSFYIQYSIQTSLYNSLNKINEIV